MEEFAMMRGLGDYLGLDLEVVGPEDVKEIHPLLDVDGELVDLSNIGPRLWVISTICLRLFSNLL